MKAYEWFTKVVYENGPYSKGFVDSYACCLRGKEAVVLCGVDNLDPKLVKKKKKNKKVKNEFKYRGREDPVEMLVTCRKCNGVYHEICVLYSVGVTNEAFICK